MLDGTGLEPGISGVGSKRRAINLSLTLPTFKKTKQDDRVT